MTALDRIFSAGEEYKARLLPDAVATVNRHAARLMPANDNHDGYPGVTSSADLVRGFVPPDYHLDGIAQSGFFYTTTAMTGTGKTAVLLLIAALTALGEPLGNLEVKQGRVLYFAGENPDDVTMHWIAMAHHMGFDADDIDVISSRERSPYPRCTSASGRTWSAWAASV
jgi:RecA-family ATPase